MTVETEGVRERFEAWAKSGGFNLARRPRFVDANQSYMDRSTRTSWTTYLAAFEAGQQEAARRCADLCEGQYQDMSYNPVAYNCAAAIRAAFVRSLHPGAAEVMSENNHAIEPLSDSEIDAIMNSPECLRVLAHFHDFQQDHADAVGADCHGDEVRAKALRARADFLESKY